LISSSCDEQHTAAIRWMNFGNFSPRLWSDQAWYVCTCGCHSRKAVKDCWWIVRCLYKVPTTPVRYWAFAICCVFPVNGIWHQILQMSWCIYHWEPGRWCFPSMYKTSGHIHKPRVCWLHGPTCPRTVTDNLNDNLRISFNPAEVTVITGTAWYLLTVVPALSKSERVSDCIVASENPNNWTTSVQRLFPPSVTAIIFQGNVARSGSCHLLLTSHYIIILIWTASPYLDPILALFLPLSILRSRTNKFKLTAIKNL